MMGCVRAGLLAAVLGTPMVRGYTDDATMAPFWERVVWAKGADGACPIDDDCGFPGITRDECHARSCCFDPRSSPWCAGTAAACADRGDCSGNGECVDGGCVCDGAFSGHVCGAAKIRKVHLIQSSHLDAGFTNTTAGVIDLYLSHHVPTAIETARALRNNTDGRRLKFLAQAYYLDFALHCPPAMGFRCPSRGDRAALRAAIAAGEITWHAFPHNAEFEAASVGTLEAGLLATKALDAAFGVPEKRSLSLRDVPGLPRSVVPVLKRHGVDLVTVGVNGASMYPRVPRAFRWRDPMSDEEVVALWHPRGYGGYRRGDAVLIDGFDEALVTDWTTDNSGPGSADHYLGVFANVSAEFPGADVVASTFDEYLAALEAAGAVAGLPVVEDEIGDSWIYGVPSDPRKTAVARALERAVAAYDGPRDAATRNFTRLASKNAEHTWGRDVKATLADDANWTNAAFAAARRADPAYAVLEEAWAEQRRWGYDIPRSALPVGHALAALVDAEVEAASERAPDGRGLRAVEGGVVDCGALVLGFDNVTGALTRLDDTVSGVGWASPSNALFEPTYRTYSQAEFRVFQDHYSNLTNPPDWFREDFGKPNETASDAALWAPSLLSVKARVDGDAAVVLVRRAFADAAHREYGAPAEILARFVVRGRNVSAALWFVDKTPTRLPETMFVAFDPAPTGDDWALEKLGQWQPARGVVAGGSQHLHGADAVRFTAASGAALAVRSADAPVFNLGEPNGFPVPCAAVNDPWAHPPDLRRYGVSSVVWNNLWGTNYVQWFPFDAADAAVLARYDLALSSS